MKSRYPCAAPRWLSLMLLLLPCTSRAQNLTPPGPVLKLTEKGRFVELPPDVFNDFTDVTVEVWVKWNRVGGGTRRVFDYGGAWRDLALLSEQKNPNLQFVIVEPGGILRTVRAENVLRAGEWLHVTGVTGSGGMKLYINGTLAGENSYTGSLKSLGGNNMSRIGQTVGEGQDHTPFDGELSEFRVWKTARSVEQIRDNITKSLTGNEEGLVALWNFADPANPGRDASPHHHDGKLIGSASAGIPAGVAGGPVSPPANAGTPNQVLVLDGSEESYVQLPPEILNGLEEVTVEGWFRWDELLPLSRIFSFGEGDYRFTAGIADFPGSLRSVLDVGPNRAGNITYRGIVVKDVLTPDRWAHIAAVIDSKEMRLYLNGNLSGTEPGAVLSLLKGGSENRLGASGSPGRTGSVRALHGAMDEVRVWKTARTVEQIQENIIRKLTGSEGGLVALWNFDDPANPGRDASPNHLDGKLTANARALPDDRAGSAASAAIAVPASRVLSLMEKGSFVELPPGLFEDQSEGTVEAWVKLNGIQNHYQRIITYDENYKNFSLMTDQGTNTLWFLLIDPNRKWQNAAAKDALKVGEWTHVAAVAGSGGMHLFVNGSEVASHPYTDGFKHLGIKTPGRLGQMPRDVSDCTPFDGELAEVRVWKTARTAQEIRENLTKQLTGAEQGLAALWNFADPANPGRDASPHHRDGKLIGNARVMAADELRQATPGGASMATVSGLVTDATGKPFSGIEVKLEQGTRQVASAKSGAEGSYFLVTSANGRPCRLTASFGQLEAVSAEAPLAAGPNRSDLKLRDTLRISGTVRGADGSPRRGVKVDAVRSADDTVAGFAVSDATGAFVLRRLPDGDYKLRAASPQGPVNFDGGKVLTVSAETPATGLTITLAAVAISEDTPQPANQVLSLDGKGGYVNLPEGMFGNLHETTIEAWVRFGTLAGSAVFNYGTDGQDLYVTKPGGTTDLQLGTHAATRDGAWQWNYVEAGSVVTVNEWCHVAVTFGSLETRLYLNGTLAATKPISYSFDQLSPVSPALIGRWNSGRPGLTGNVDEFRVWAMARSAEELRENMFRRLTGREEGLAALWNFDDPARPGKDATPNGFDGTLESTATVTAESLPSDGDHIKQWARLAGSTTDKDGRALRNVSVRLVRGNEEKEVQSDERGNFWFFVPASPEPWRLTARLGDESAVPENPVLDRGDNRWVPLALRDASLLSGRVLAPDDTPLAAVVVQAVPVAVPQTQPPAEEPGLRTEIFRRSGMTVLPAIPESDGPDLTRTDRKIDFPLAVNSIAGPEFNNRLYVRWSGKLRIASAGEVTFFFAANEGGRVFIDGREVVTSQTTGTSTLTLDQIEQSGTLTLAAGAHDLLVELYNPTGRDGCRLSWSVNGGEKAVIPEAAFFHKAPAPELMTTLTNSRGRYRFPGVLPAAYIVRAQVPGGTVPFDDGKTVMAVQDQPASDLDFRISPYKKGWWKNYSHTDGLADDSVVSVFQAADGAMWFGGKGGVSRFDGVKFTSLTTRDGLPDTRVTSIVQADDGSLLFGTDMGLWRHQSKSPERKLDTFGWDGKEKENLAPLDESQTANNGGVITMKTGEGDKTTALPVISAMAKDSGGRIWLGIGNQLWRADRPAGATGKMTFARVVHREKVISLMDRGPSGLQDVLRGAATTTDAEIPGLAGPNRVLVINGTSSYLQIGNEGIPLAGPFTMEAWIRPETITGFGRVFGGGTGSSGRSPSLFVRQDGALHGGFGTGSRWRSWITPANAVHTGRWNHVAFTYDGKTQRAWVNGVVVVEFPSTETTYGSPVQRVGSVGTQCAGRIDEVRIWKTARTEKEIKDNMDRRLTVPEPGLEAAWSFEETTDEERDVPVETKAAISSLYGDAAGVIWIGAADGVTRFDGKSLTLLSASDGLAPGEVVSIHQSADGAMWFGTNGNGVSRYRPAAAPEEAWTTFTRKDGLIDNRVHRIASDHEGNIWLAASSNNSSGGEVLTGLSRYDGKSFVNFTAADGLASEVVYDLLVDPRGGVWAGTLAGVSHYDAQSMTIYDFRDGLDDGAIRSLTSTADGSVWVQVGESPGKLSRFDGQRMVKVTRDDGLTGTDVTSLYLDRDGALLVGDQTAPVARLVPSAVPGDKPRFETLAESGGVFALSRAPSGQLWMGTSKGTAIAGLPDAGKEIGPTQFIRTGVDGVMWFGTNDGSVWRRAGAEFTEVRQSDGGESSWVRGMLPLPDGSLVLATMGGALRLEGDRFQPWPSDQPRLQQVRCFDAIRDADGRVWLGTAEGAQFTDGTAWGKIDVRDHLPENAVNRVHVASDGTVWLGTWFKGVARYRPQKLTPPTPELTVQSDRDYIDPAALPPVHKGQRVTFKCSVVDLYTSVEKRQYRWQVFQGTRSEAELKDGWQKPAPNTQVEPDLDKHGDWTVAVQYIDRDLNYSPPRLFPLKVVLPWQSNPAILIPAGAGAAGLLGWAFVARVLYVRKRREAEKLRELMLQQEHAAREALQAKNRQLEEARKAADEASQAKSTFLANMSHELRTPMNAIIGYSEMLQEEAQDMGDDAYIPDLQKIHGAGKHLLGLINDILDLSKVEAGRMTLYLEEFDVAKMVNEVAATVEPLIARNSNRLVVECPADIGSMKADVTKLRQTLFNLLSNASKFTEKGSITLTVERSRNHQLSTINFKVTDTGIGIGKEALGRLFQAFEQADASTTKKFGGTGLGLAISKKFCRLMGGDITVKSEPGQGTTFTVTLPLTVIDPAVLSGQRAVARGPLPPAPHGTVLVIDDDPNVRDLMERTLAKDGYRVATAPDGARGLALAKELIPAVITLDVMMPGIDGWAVLTALKADPATVDIPVVMLTIVDDKNMGFALGAAEYFTKPIDWQRLAGVLRKHRRTDGPHSVLIVEDDPHTRDMLRRGMEKDGWTTVDAEDGRRGLERLAESIPSLILLDLMMPEMDGFEFMQELRKREDCRTVPVIVITAMDLTAADHARLNGHVARIIQKSSAGTEQLLTEVRSLLAHSADWHI